MPLTQEERQRIYEEEKARLEAERVTGGDGSNTVGLTPNLAGLLCYLGMWVAGIVLLALEQKNRFVRFHAAQSIVVFGALTLFSIFLRFIPVVGGLIAIITGLLTFVLWLILMVKAYRGEFYRLPVAAELAEALLKAINPDSVGDISKEGMVVVVDPKPVQETPRSRAKDVLGAVGSIVFSLVALIFLNFFHEYIAYYSRIEGVWTKQALLTSEWHTWLPIFDVAVVLSIVGYVILAMDGRRLVQEVVRVAIDVLAIIAMGSLLYVFPFDFQPLPISVSFIEFVVRLCLVVAIAATAVAGIVKLIKLAVIIVRN